MYIQDFCISKQELKFNMTGNIVHRLNRCNLHDGKLAAKVSLHGFTQSCFIPGSDCELVDITGRAILCATEVKAWCPQFTRTDDSAGVQVSDINKIAEGHSRQRQWRDPGDSKWLQ